MKATELTYKLMQMPDWQRPGCHWVVNMFRGADQFYCVTVRRLAAGAASVIDLMCRHQSIYKADSAELTALLSVARDECIDLGLIAG